MSGAKPEHVPEALFRPFDFFAFPGSERDVHGAWKKLHQGPEMFWTPLNGGHWVCTRADDIETIYGDYSRFSSATESLPRGATPLPQPPVEIDPPAHDAYRRIIMPEFSPRAMQGLERRARELTVSLIEGFRAAGHCEFVREFAKHMPIGIFLSIMQLPREDAARLVPLAEAKTRNSDVATSLNVHMQILDYIREKIEERRRRPGDDLISRVIRAEVNGRPLSHDEAVAMCGVVTFAGLDTVVSSLGFVMRFLAENPGHRRQLRENKALIPNAVNEFLRRFSPTNLAREVRRDMRYNGVELRAGDAILLPTCLHGLDERRWNAPMQVDFDRQRIFHLAFGTGAHRCVGANLARTELRVMLEEWLPRIADFEITPGETPVTASGQVNAVTHLPISWRVH
jgi:cytochrome P450